MNRNMMYGQEKKLLPRFAMNGYLLPPATEQAGKLTICWLFNASLAIVIII